MSSPSGFDTAVRGVVMLGVLGGAAWGAMQYPPICECATRLWRDWEQGTLLKPQHDGVAQARSAGGDAPPFAAAELPSADGDGPRSVPATMADDTRSVPLTDLSPRALVTDEASQLLPQPRRPLPPEMQSKIYPEQQVDFRRPGTGGSNGATTRPAEAIADLEARLSRLGATYCLLERWGQDPPRYRFHCRVTLSPGTEPRRFEASGSDPMLVMQEVADAVATCRAQRNP